MNQKKAKALRRAIRDDGYPKVEMAVRHSRGLLGVGMGAPITYVYPADSFQRVYHDMKRAA